MANGQASGDSTEGILETVWRHKVLMVVSFVICVAIGFWLHQRKPISYAASTQLMILSDTPLILDVDTGGMVGGVPDFEVLRTLVKSDRIIVPASMDSAFSGVTGLSSAAIAQQLRAGVVFHTEKKIGKTDRTVASLSYNGADPDFCVTAVNAIARAIEAQFEQERTSAVNGLSGLISKAENKLRPQLNEWEAKYKTFRDGSPLSALPNGDVVNPHRERQGVLRVQEAELENQRRSLNANYRLIEATWKRERDVSLVMQVIEQLGGGYTDEPGPEFAELDGRMGNMAADRMAQEVRDDDIVRDLQIRDLELEGIEVEQTLTPLIVERERAAAEFGDSHPSVRSLTSQVKATREKLNSIARKRQRRIDQLRRQQKQEMEERYREQGDDGSDIAKQLRAERERLLAEQDERHRKFIRAYTNALQQRITLVDEQLIEVRQDITTEKGLADELAQVETDDAMYKRNIESIQGMLIELEQQMAGLNISEINHGVRVDSLDSVVVPYVTGPKLANDMILASLVGVVVGGLLSVLIEANAKTFRTSTQISTELDLPVVAHIPLDADATNRKRSAATGEAAEMHPNLAVVHRPESAPAEAIRCTRTTLLFDSAKTGNKVYQVSSPLPGDGKSTIAANLACALAQSGKRTLLIDLDLRSPRLSSRMGYGESLGVTNLLNGETDPRTGVYQTPVPGLSFLPSGTIPSNPAEALLVPELADAIDWFRDHYDFVIVDTPPLLLVTDPAIITSYVDSAILTMRIVRKSKPNAKESVAILRNTGVNILGVAVNKLDDTSGAAYYQAGGEGGYSGIGYGYGKQYRNERRRAGQDVENYEVKGCSRTPSAAALEVEESVESV